jgi:hypothetical protein
MSADDRVAAITASNLKSINKGSVVCVADITVTKWRFTFCGCLYCRKGDREWISLPSKEWTDKQGKRRFTPLGEFRNNGDAARFSEAAIAAIKAAAGDPS